MYVRTHGGARSVRTYVRTCNRLTHYVRTLRVRTYARAHVRITLASYLSGPRGAVRTRRSTPAMVDIFSAALGSLAASESPVAASQPPVAARKTPHRPHRRKRVQRDVSESPLLFCEEGATSREQGQRSNPSRFSRHRPRVRARPSGFRLQRAKR